jgi:outer membrane protein OmpA-like peptidoglycan-associated protein
MKKITFLTLLMTLTFLAQGQILKKVTDKVKNKVNNPANKPVSDSTGKRNEDKDAAIETYKADTTKKIDKAEPGPAGIKAYSKYDFVPGEKVIGFEDFSTGNIGDFPASWNTSSSAEIVTIEGITGRWLWLTKPGVFVPEFTDKYPEDFTFEFDLLHGIPINGAYFHISLAELENIAQPQHWTLGPNRIHFELNTSNTGAQNGESKYDLRKNAVSEPAISIESKLLSDENNPVHISIWRQKERVRLYINHEKIWDIPKALAKESKLNALVFYVNYAEEVVKHYISNLRLAIGAPDTRNKMLTQNKWVTHGILFDVNSANIKPESYGTLKEMANVLKENPDLKVKIVGHTDADGNDANNLDLSKRRAASVKAALAKEFSIDVSRMETDGKGESESIDKNDNPAGKANNRRVEFIKI